MIEIDFTDHHLIIKVEREALFNWITGEAKRLGYKTGDGSLKDFPNDAGTGSEETGSEPEPGSESTGEPQFSPDGADMFEERGGKGGKITNPQAKELTVWLKENKFSVLNFSVFLKTRTELAGHKLSGPPIKSKADGTPSIFQVAQRWFYYWKSAHEEIAKDYKSFVLAQLAAKGYAVEMALEVFEGSEEVDPNTLEPVK